MPSTSPLIAVVTGSRADFGLLAPVMHAIAAHPRLRLAVIVTGAHLPTGTWRDVPAAGLTIAAKIPMQKKDQVGRAADVDALGRGIIHLGRCFAQIKPQVVMVLGDRIEALAAGCAAHVGGFLLAHVHGGDRAEGVADEAMRHAVSKLAHLHFPATPQSRQRLIRMGEPLEFIFQLGSPSIDGLRQVKPASDEELEALHLDPAQPYALIVQHPIGAADVQEEKWMRATLRAVGGKRGMQSLVLHPNLDPGHAGILRAITSAKVNAIAHLPRPQFAGVLARAAVIVGNSSAGLIEAAALRVPCVNIGSRQNGREKPNHVIDAAYGEKPVHAALAQALKLKRRSFKHPYGDGHTGEKIAQTLARLNFSHLRLHKQNTY